MSGPASIDLQTATTRGAIGASSSGHDEDLYAKWRDIFDQAPPSLGHEQQRYADAASDARDESASYGEGEHVLGTSMAAGRDSRRWRSIPTTDDRHGDSRMRGVYSVLASQPGATSSHAPGTAIQLSASALSAMQPMPKTAAAAEAAPLQSTMPAPQRSAPAAEAVSVFVKGTTVTVVVRNAALGEQEALDSAFDTARELTGSTSGLQQLTVNGRVLYRQPAATGAGTAPAGVLRFAC